MDTALTRRFDRHSRGLVLEIRDLCDGNRYEWNGAHMVNVYTLEGENVDVWSFGDFSQNAATVEEFLASVMDHLDEVSAEVEA
jgi:hypothetical protein